MAGQKPSSPVPRPSSKGGGFTGGTCSARQTARSPRCGAATAFPQKRLRSRENRASAPLRRVRPLEGLGCFLSRVMHCTESGRGEFSPSVVAALRQLPRQREPGGLGENLRPSSKKKRVYGRNMVPPVRPHAARYAVLLRRFRRYACGHGR